MYKRQAGAVGARSQPEGSGQQSCRSGAGVAQAGQEFGEQPSQFSLLGGGETIQDGSLIGQVALDDAGHFVFTGPCQNARRLLTVLPTGFCSDPGWDRQHASAVTRHYVAAFLLAELAGEPASAAALSTNADPVENVQYRAAGY